MSTLLSIRSSIGPVLNQLGSVVHAILDCEQDGPHHSDWQAIFAARLRIWTPAGWYRPAA